MTNKEMQQLLLDKMELVAQGICSMSTSRTDVSYALALEKLALAHKYLREAEE